MIEALIVLLIGGAYFTGYIISLYALAVYIDPDEVESLFPGLPRKRRDLLKKLADDPRSFTQIALVYKSFALISAAFLGLQLIPTDFGMAGVTRPVATVLVLLAVWLLYIVSMEYLPRRRSLVAISPQMIRQLWLISTVYMIFYPVVTLYRDALKRGGNGVKVSEEDKEEIVERAIETLAEEAGITETIVEEDEKEMIGQIFQLDQTVVKEIMVPRTDVTAVEKKMTFKEIRDMVKADGHSRFPVYDEKIDKILGLLYVKDLFNSMPEPGETFNISKYLRKPFFVPETKVIGELLQEFKARRQHIAVVVDEYGGVAGIVTLEDIIEEIFGEIQDEHDWEEDEVTKQTDGSYSVNANMLLERLQDLYDTDYDQSEYDTVGGLLYDLAGSVPAEGQMFRWNRFEFEVKKVEGQRIKRVNIRHD